MSKFDRKNKLTKNDMESNVINSLDIQLKTPSNAGNIKTELDSTNFAVMDKVCDELVGKMPSTKKTKVE